MPIVTDQSPKLPQQVVTNWRNVLGKIKTKLVVLILSANLCHIASPVWTPISKNMALIIPPTSTEISTEHDDCDTQKHAPKLLQHIRLNCLNLRVQIIQTSSSIVPEHGRQSWTNMLNIVDQD